MIPRIPSFHPLGHIPTYKKNPIAFLEKHWRQTGDIFTFRVAHRSLIAVHHPNYIKRVLQDNHTNYRKTIAYRKLRLLLGNGLFTSEGDFWLKQRRLSQPAFHKEKIQGYFTSMVTYTESMLAAWESSNATSIAVHASMTELTLKIISKTLLGLDLKKEGKVVEENLPFALQFMMHRIVSVVSLPIQVPIPSHQKFIKSVANLNNLIETLIQEKRNPENVNDDLLAMLMSIQDEETGEKMSNAQLRDEVITFFLAGHETSAVALTWALYHIASRKDIANKINTEIDLLGEETISLASFQKTPYLVQVLKETMRLNSPIWIMGREAIHADIIEQSTVHPKDSIIFSPYLVHRHPDFWEKPNEFIPERFSPENEKNIHKFSYFPFGAGPRMCIGQGFAMMEMQLILLMILRKFSLSLSDTKIPEFEFSLTLRPTEEIYLTLTKKLPNTIYSPIPE